MEEKADVGREAEALRWHPAFFTAIQMELKEYGDALEYHYEYQLTSEPLRIDTLIIKKPKDITITKNIARIFRSDNIIEFKSPSDYISVRDFLKVYSYATLYAAITPLVNLSDITITFVAHGKAQSLIEYLTAERRYTVEEKLPGIYTVYGDYIPIQIIEVKKLPEAENLWLTSLTNDLEIAAARAILKESREWVRKAGLGAYLEVLLKANPKTFLEVVTMSNEHMTFEEVFTEAGIIPQWIEKGIEQGIEKGIEQGKEEKALEIARNLLAKGWTPEEIAEVILLPVEKIKSFTTR